MGQRILLFDDDYDSLSPFKGMLETEGYEVELTAAQDILPRLALEKFDLICVDHMIHHRSPNADEEIVENVKYPDISWINTGQEFLRRLRAGEYAGENGRGTDPNVPVIVLSATADPSEETSANFVYEKPFDIDVIVSRIEKLLKKPL